MVDGQPFDLCRGIKGLIRALFSPTILPAYSHVDKSPPPPHSSFTLLASTSLKLDSSCDASGHSGVLYLVNVF